MERFCKNCGNKLSENANFCNRCGMRTDSIGKEQRINNNNIDQVNIPVNMNEKTKNKKWYQKTGGIIFWLIIFFPVGIYMMWKYANWKKGLKVVISIVFLFFMVGMFLPDNLESEDTVPVSSENGGSVIRNDDVDSGAVYKHSFVETKQKMNEILSNFYGENIDLDVDYKKSVEFIGDDIDSYTYTSGVSGIPEGYYLGVDLRFKDGNCWAIGVKTDTTVNLNGLEDIQEIFLTVVNQMTDDTLDAVEIERLLNEGKIVYYRNNNLYELGAEVEGVFYYSVMACTEKQAKEVGAQILD